MDIQYRMTDILNRMTETPYKDLGSKYIFFMILKEVFYPHKGCIYIQIHKKL